MPRYFFDFDDGSTPPERDDEGVELPDDQAARDEASRTLAEMAHRFIPDGNTQQRDIALWVRSEDGAPLLHLSLTFAIKPLKPHDEYPPNSVKL